MRYIREQIITKTIFDDAIDDDGVVLLLLNDIVKNKLIVKMVFRDPLVHSIKECENVRIDVLSDLTESIDIAVFKNKFIYKVRGVKIKDILEICLSSEISPMPSEKSLSVFDVLDIS
ncbi:MAG: hypothetical protein WDA06_00030 [Phenylobacterium sp.]